MEYVELIGYKSAANVRARLESIAYYPFHLHRGDLEIICVLNGSVKIYASAASYTLSYGDIYFFNPNDPHKIVSDDPKNIILTIHINRKHYTCYFEDLENCYFICDTYTQPDTYSFDIRHLRFQLAKLYKTYVDKHSDIQLEDMTRGLLELLVGNFQEYVYKADADQRPALIRLQNRDYLYKNYNRMYRIVDFVMENFRSKITLEQIARQEYLSTAHLSRYIKETLGLTFSQLLSLTRCEETARLLSNTNKTIDQIAIEVGFANRKHLAIQFRKWFDQTPTQYRNDILRDLGADSQVQFNTFDYDYALKLIDMYLDEF